MALYKERTMVTTDLRKYSIFFHYPLTLCAPNIITMAYCLEAKIYTP
jgi:hypothetical protein